MVKDSRPSVNLKKNLHPENMTLHNLMWHGWQLVNRHAYVHRNLHCACLIRSCFQTCIRYLFIILLRPNIVRRCHILKTQLRCYRSCDFKTQMRFQNADAISKRRCDFKTQMRFQNADAISKRRCDFKTQMRFQNADALPRPWVPVLRM